jgi:hypothetical protein
VQPAQKDLQTARLKSQQRWLFNFQQYYLMESKKAYFARFVSKTFYVFIQFDLAELGREGCAMIPSRPLINGSCQN